MSTYSKEQRQAINRVLFGLPVPVVLPPDPRLT